MGRPDRDNRAQTPVGYSHGTGVSIGGLATAVLGVVARDTPGVHGVVRGRATTLPALRCTRCGALWGVTRGCGDSLQAPGAARKW